MTVELVDLVQSNYSSTIFIQKSKTSSLCQLEQHKLLPINVKYNIFVRFGNIKPTTSEQNFCRVVNVLMYFIQTGQSDPLSHSLIYSPA